jgi:hypothetical protein
VAWTRPAINLARPLTLCKIPVKYGMLQQAKQANEMGDETYNRSRMDAKKYPK